MSNEVKVGLLALVALSLSIWGFNYLGGKNLFSASNVYTVEYEDIMGLPEAAPVYLRGLKVGLVSSIYLNPGNTQRVVVELDIEKGLRLPKNTKAVLYQSGLMSGTAIKLEFDKYCEGANCAESGDQLLPGKEGVLESMLGMNPTEYTQDMPSALFNVLDSLNTRIANPQNDAVMAQTLRDVQKTMQNLTVITQKLDRLIGSSAGKFDNILGDMSSLTENLKQSNGKINRILDNTATLTANLAETDVNTTLRKMDGTLTSVDGTLGEADNALAQVTESLNTADQALNEISTLVNKMNDGEGTLGYLLTNDQLAKDLENTLKQVGELSENLKEKPYEYMPLKSRRKIKRYRRKDAEEGR